MLRFSGITGTDAATGAQTKTDGLSGSEFNTFKWPAIYGSAGAAYRMPTDPNHEFPERVHQLCGPAATYRGGPYPAIHDSRFVATYVASGGKDPAEVMKCFRPEQLPVLNALAREFAVCDKPARGDAARAEYLAVPAATLREPGCKIKTRSDVLA
jgi:phospholipase C